MHNELLMTMELASNIYVVEFVCACKKYLISTILI